MKRFLLLTAALVLCLQVTAQINYVPNGSFEAYNYCPTTHSIPYASTGWRMYTIATADYYNSCAGSNVYSGVPSSGSNYQYAAHGEAYMGVFTLVPPNLNYKEYVGRAITPLQAGTKYEVSMSVALANASGRATNDLGVFFYDKGPDTMPVTTVLPFTPHVTYESYHPIKDTQNWVRVRGVFTADSAYDNMVIGGFKDGNTVKIDTLHSNIGCYYLIDSVVVRVLDSFRVVMTDSFFCAGSTIQVGYNIWNRHNVNNIYTAQLSDASGSFATPLNIGSLTTNSTGTISCALPSNLPNGAGYRVRVIASSFADTTRNIGPAIRIANIDSSAVTVTHNSPICEGNTLNMSASTNIPATTCSWTGPNSFSSSISTPAIASAQPLHSGNYIVSIKFYGCTKKDTLALRVKPLPAKPASLSNSPLCEKETIRLNASSGTPGVNYSWTGPLTYSSTQQNPQIGNADPAMSGNYIVVASLEGCTRADTTSVTVKALPQKVILGSNSPLCDGDTLQLTTTTSTNGSAYLWTGPLTYSSTTVGTSIPNATPARSGWYKMTITLNGCIISDSTSVIIHPIPTSPVASYNSPICASETLKLQANTISNATYTWTGPGSYTANTQNADRNNIQVTDMGKYSVTATVNGCTSPANEIDVHINPSPFAVILPLTGDTICTGDNATFMVLPNNHGGTPLYQWRINGSPVGVSSTTFTTNTLNDGDIIRCDMTEFTKCYAPFTDIGNDVQMTVMPWLAPSVSFTANPNRPLQVNEYVTFTATPKDAGPNPTYQWKHNGKNVQGATSAIWSANTLNDNDSISVEIFSSYRCPQPPTASAKGIIVKVLSSVNDVPANNLLQVYPNPASNFVVFELDKTVAASHIVVINAVGQLVYQSAFQAGKTTWDTEQVAAGVYTFKLMKENEMLQAGRVVIAK